MAAIPISRVSSLLAAILAAFTAVTNAADVQTGNSWTELGLLNVGRFACKAHNVDGRRAIVFAGWGDTSGPADTSAEILDTITGRWTLTAPMPPGFVPGASPWTARLEHGYFLVMGGFNAIRSGDRSSYIYSVSRDLWIRTGDLPAASTVASNFGQTDAIVLDDGRVLAAGGLAVTGETSASVVFTPNYANFDSGLSGDAVGTWDFTRDGNGRVTSLSGPSEHHKLIKLADGRVLLIVGYDQVFQTKKWGSVFRDTPGVQAELFDAVRGIWTAVPDLPAVAGEDDRHDGVKGVRQQATVALLGDGRVLVAGGFSQPTDSAGNPLLKDLFYERASAILFDPHLLDTGAYPWSITSPLHVGRDTHVMGNLLGTNVMVVWGQTHDAATATAEVYDTTQGVWRFVAGLAEFKNTGLPVSMPPGCSAMMPGGTMLVVGGGFDFATRATSRRTYSYHP